MLELTFALPIPYPMLDVDLCQAAKCGNVEVAKVLLDNGADLYCAASDGRTPIAFCDSDDQKNVKALLEKVAVELEEKAQRAQDELLNFLDEDGPTKKKGKKKKRKMKKKAKAMAQTAQSSVESEEPEEPEETQSKSSSENDDDDDDSKDVEEEDVQEVTGTEKEDAPPAAEEVKGTSLETTADVTEKQTPSVNQKTTSSIVANTSSPSSSPWVTATSSSNSAPSAAKSSKKQALPPASQQKPATQKGSAGVTTNKAVRGSKQQRSKPSRSASKKKDVSPPPGHVPPKATVAAAAPTEQVKRHATETTAPSATSQQAWSSAPKNSSVASRTWASLLQANGAEGQTSAPQHPQVNEQKRDMSAPAPAPASASTSSSDVPSPSQQPLSVFLGSSPFSGPLPAVPQPPFSTTSSSLPQMFSRHGPPHMTSSSYLASNMEASPPVYQAPRGPQNMTLKRLQSLEAMFHSLDPDIAALELDISHFFGNNVEDLSLSQLSVLEGAHQRVMSRINDAKLRTAQKHSAELEEQLFRLQRRVNMLEGSLFQKPY